MEDETGITIEFLETQGKPKTHRTFEEGSTDTPYSSSFSAGLSKVLEETAASFYHSERINDRFLFLFQRLISKFVSLLLYK